MDINTWFVLLVEQPDWIANINETTDWALGMVRNYLGLAGVSTVLFYLVKPR